MKAAVVLAAGTAARMGRQKLLLTYQGRPLVAHAAEAAVSSSDAAYLVSGHRRREVEAAVMEDLPPLTAVYNADYADGMGASLAAGIGALPDGCRAALILLGDQPHVAADHCRRLWQAYDEAAAGVDGDGESAAGPIVYFEAETAPQPPIIFDSAHFPALQALEGDRGARPIAAAHPEVHCRLAPPDGPWQRDIDTPEDYRTAGV